MSQETMRPTLIRLLFLLLWFLLIATASLWLPAHEGDIDRSETTFVPVYAVIAAVAAFTVRRRARSVREALLSALPVLAILSATVVLGVLLNAQDQVGRGGPLYLYFGVAIWASWAMLMLVAALLSRAKWNGVAGISIGVFVAILGLALFTAQVD